MARIRTIKPEFWADEKLSPLDPLTRLVFLGLMSQADDAGRLVDSVRQIDGMLFPFSEESSRDSLDTLARLSRVIRYTSESGQQLLQIREWEKHQKVDKPSKHVLPAPTPGDLTECGVARVSRDPRDTSSRDSRAPTLDLVRGPRTPDPGPLSLREAEGEATNDSFNEFWAIGGVGGMLPAERAYYEHVNNRLVTHGELLRAYAAYKALKGDSKIQKNTSNWIAERGYMDTTLRPDPHEEANRDWQDWTPERYDDYRSTHPDWEPA